LLRNSRLQKHGAEKIASRKPINESEKVFEIAKTSIKINDIVSNRQSCAKNIATPKSVGVLEEQWSYPEILIAVTYFSSILGL